ncbi:MAG: alkaline phosphatase family protein [Caldilineaceae bacterium]
MQNCSARLILLLLSVILLLGHYPNWTPPISQATRPAVAHSDAPLPNFSHIFVIVMENKEQGAIVGNHDAAYINQLAAQFGQANHFYATTHPSLPNYLAMTGGDTFGVTSDCTDCFVNADNLAAQLESAGRTWKAYIEGMPSPCFVGDAPPDYRQKHNPFIYYDNVRQTPARCDHIVPFPQLAADLQANRLPDFVWISPSMCHSMHDCDIRTGDAWLKTWVSQIVASPAWQQDGVLFITFDEGKGPWLLHLRRQRADRYVGCFTAGSIGHYLGHALRPLLPLAHY